jgi:hypothetical protein
MSIARLTESIRRAAQGIVEPRRIMLSELTAEHDAPPPSTIRRIIRDWADDGVELAGHRVRAEKGENRLYLVIYPHGEEPAPLPKPVVMSIPLYHQFGRVISR